MFKETIIYLVRINITKSHRVKSNILNAFIALWQTLACFYPHKSRKKWAILFIWMFNYVRLKLMTFTLFSLCFTVNRQFTSFDMYIFSWSADENKAITSASIILSSTHISGTGQLSIGLTLLRYKICKMSINEHKIQILLQILYVCSISLPLKHGTVAMFIFDIGPAVYQR